MNKVIYATVTQKGQVTIPKEFRDALSIEKYGNVEITRTGKVIKIKPAKDFLDLGGTLLKYARKNRGVDPLEAREYMSKNYRR